MSSEPRVFLIGFTSVPLADILRRTAIGSFFVYGRQWGSRVFEKFADGIPQRLSAFDEHEEVRVAELPATAHPFFVGTLFQPERAALRDELPPLVAAFVRAIGSK